MLKVIEIARESNTKIILNPAPFKELPNRIYPLVDYLIPNEYEAKGLTGICIDSEASAKQAMKKFKEMGARNVIITLGEKGCVYNDGDAVVFHPAERVKAVDTTSAGDCFIGATVLKLAKDRPLSEAIAFAAKASAITVSRSGAAASIPYEDEIE